MAPPGLNINLAWYGAITARRSRRRFSPRVISASDLAALQAFCDRCRPDSGVRVAMRQGHPEVYTGALQRIGGAYGRVEGAPWTAAFVGPDGAENDIGYVGEAFVLEATRLGLGTCWIAGSFDRSLAESLVSLREGERVHAITPVGHPLERKAFVERVMSGAVRSAARRQIEEIAPTLKRGLGPAHDAWPAWAITAVEAARLAPSGGNKQPWRFRLDSDALVLSGAEKAYWTAPIDFGIAMLHAELGAAYEGVRGVWQSLPEPDVARFVPGEAGAHRRQTTGR
ncbi:MAG: nitroreductase family protein [Thermoleophilia bacterium]